MLMSLYVEPKDTVEVAAKTACHISKALNVNVKFYFDRVAHYVTPTSMPEDVIAKIHEASPSVK
jgi:hypothetical protein